MLYKELPSQETDMISAYIEAYSHNEHVTSYKRPLAPLEKILQHWDKAKQEYLYQMLGNQFIVSKEISFQRPEEELSEDINTTFFGWVSTPVNKFVRDFLDVSNNFEIGSPFGGLSLRGLLNPETLKTNIYDGWNFEITAPSGKVIKINSGCKAARAIGKIAQAFGIEGFEEFRIAHSQILNQKDLHGRMCLSIHPMDYMTMSDNNTGWDSCMSWANYGGYRSGTIEMMNSSCVVVAYVTAEKDMETVGGTWNNKKWRELFVVTPEIISGVKGYPYSHKEFEDSVILWLRELAMKNCGFGPYTEKTCNLNPGYNTDFEEINQTLMVEFHTKRMYNDFYDDNYRCVININQTEDLDITYSGDFSCMNCGEIETDGCDEGDKDFLVCSECVNLVRCYCCDERVSRGESYQINGETLCEYCYDQKTFECGCCHTLSLEEDIRGLRLATRDGDLTDLVISICGDCHDDETLEYFAKDSIKVKNHYWSYIDYVRIQDCTPKGLALFGVNSQEEADELEKEYLHRKIMNPLIF